MKRVLIGVLAGIALMALNACAPILVGGAFLGGGFVVADRRTTGTQLEDETIELKATARLSEVLGEQARTNVVSYNRHVLLLGEVASAKDKQKATQVVQAVENVENVLNELNIGGSSGLTARLSDSVVTGRVKSAIVNSKDLYANAFKVVTERGTVYLMGRVTQQEANRAAEIARTVPGVQKVVRVFEILTPEELAQLAPAVPQSSGPAQAP